MSVAIRFYRPDGKEVISCLAHGESKSRLMSFVQRIATKTTASINWAAVTSEIRPSSPESSGDFQSLDHYAFLRFRDASGKSWAFKLFAPKDNLFEEQPGGDLIVLPETGVQIAGWYSDLAAEKLTFVRGAYGGSSRSC